MISTCSIGHVEPRAGDPACPLGAAVVGSATRRAVMRFSQQWRRCYGALAPLGWRLRAALPDRWTRIHSLPDAKRYPETSAEERELLRRHNEVATAALGERGACWLVACDAYELPEVPGISLAPSLRVGPDEQLAERITFHVARVIWRQGAFDPLLLAIAEDRCRALWMRRATGEVFAPYDGGVDLILRDRARRDALRERWPGWRSRREDGL